VLLPVSRSQIGLYHRKIAKVNSKTPDFEYVKLHHARWNLVDMINTAGRASIPATLFYDIDVSWTEALRAKFAALGHKITVTAVLLKAIAIAQVAHPSSRTVMLPTGQLIQLNSLEGQFTVERFVGKQPAVFFGSIKRPDQKLMTDITRELHTYGTAPVEDVPQLEIEDRFSKFPWFVRQIMIFFGMRIPQIRLRFMGATFGLSSLGKYGCRNLISPSVITSVFCVGEVEDRAVVVEGKIVARPILSMVLNFDHRVMDGAAAARFMQDIIDLLHGGLEEHVREELAWLCSKDQKQESRADVARRI
jgi:pyruvate/2-oxoglutarate dehydrogenase complex dihydrolipoamide acyltransferase (E2) component